MINPHQVLDYENWWNKSLNNIKPYRIPPLSNDIVTKLHNQLDASSDRIWRTRSAEEATKIIELLRELINSNTEHTSESRILVCLWKVVVKLIWRVRVHRLETGWATQKIIFVLARLRIAPLASDWPGTFQEFIEGYGGEMLEPTRPLST